MAQLVKLVQIPMEILESIKTEDCKNDLKDIFINEI